MTNTEMKDCGILDKLWDEIEAYAEAHCSGDSINIYDVAMIIGKYRSSDGGCKLCKRKEMEVEKLPPVNLEPKTGYWIYYRNEKGDYINQCSECGQDCGVGYPYNFCPSCGIKMIGTKNKDNTDDQYNREKCYECCNKDKSVLDMPCCKCSAENDYVYFNAHEWEYESIASSDEE